MKFNPEFLKLIGKHLYLFAAGMLFMQFVLYLKGDGYILTSTLIALIFIVTGNIIRNEASKIKKKMHVRIG